jgi:hypothetical protein
VRVDVLARKVGIRLFIVTALVVCGALLALFLAPELFEYDHDTPRFGDRE